MAFTLVEKEHSAIRLEEREPLHRADWWAHALWQ